MIDWTTPWNRELFAFMLEGSCFGLLYIPSVYMSLVTSLREWNEGHGLLPHAPSLLCSVNRQDTTDELLNTPCSTNFNLDC